MIDPADRPEYLRGPLKFYWVDTGSACGLVVVKVDVDAVVDCAPYWKRWFIGRTLEELCDWNPGVRIRKLPGDDGWKEHEKMEKALTGRRQRGRVR